jgi:uncharacterized damage-inducible protein DinB
MAQIAGRRTTVIALRSNACFQDHEEHSRLPVALTFFRRARGATRGCGEEKTNLVRSVYDPIPPRRRLVKISDALLPEFDQEMANTRKTLERIPEDKLSWKPHEKSMTLGRLAGHVAELPGFATTTIGRDSLNLSSGEYKPLFAASRQQVLEAFDQKVVEARAAIAGASDEHLMKPWSLEYQGKTIFTLPRVAVLRGMTFNHIVHHRAQLTVYLRLNDVPVPALYGPSADEGVM